MARNSFATEVKTALAGLQTGNDYAPVNACDLSHHMHIQTRAKHKSMLNVLGELTRRGEAQRIGTGRYRLTGQLKPRTLGDRLWSLVRSAKGSFSVNGISTLAECHPEVAREYLHGWSDMGYLLMLNGEYRLDSMNDPGPETPFLETRSEKNRKNYEKRTAALKAALHVNACLAVEFGKLAAQAETWVLDLDRQAENINACLKETEEES